MFLELTNKKRSLTNIHNKNKILINNNNDLYLIKSKYEKEIEFKKNVFITNKY